MTEEILKVEHLDKFYGDRQVLHDINFSLKKGEVLTLLGPALTANIIFLIKETSIFSVIAIPELTNTALDLIGMYYRSNEYLLMLVIAYAIILIPVILLLTWLERRVRYGAFGN